MVLHRAYLRYTRGYLGGLGAAHSLRFNLQQKVLLTHLGFQRKEQDCLAQSNGQNKIYLSQGLDRSLENLGD